MILPSNDAGSPGSKIAPFELAVSVLSEGPVAAVKAGMPLSAAPTVASMMVEESGKIIGLKGGESPVLATTIF
jgi:hypothetical protein